MRKARHFSLTAEEKDKSNILVVFPEEDSRIMLRRQLHSLGFKQVSETQDYFSAQKKLLERRFSHLLFDVTYEDDCKNFVAVALTNDPEMFPIAVADVPDIDQMFDLLTAGARGYLVAPFTTENIDEVIAIATHGAPIPEELLKVTNRSQLLMAALASALDRLAEAKKKADSHESVKRKLPQLTAALNQAVRQALAFSKGGKEEYLESLENYLVVRSSGPASRLGRVRQRLARMRQK